MNNFLITIICVFLFNHIALTADIGQTENKQMAVRCAPQLQKSFDAIQKIPEASDLITSIAKEGPLQITVKNSDLSNQFGAYWDPDNRIICISLHANRSEGSIIGSILFELQNAAKNSTINSLDDQAINRKISKAKYVESMEYMEYLNSLNAAKIADIGIKMGVLPRDARLYTYSNFEEHFTAQKEHGHSAHFARCYDELSSQMYIQHQQHSNL